MLGISGNGDVALDIVNAIFFSEFIPDVLLFYFWAIDAVQFDLDVVRCTVFFELQVMDIRVVFNPYLFVQRIVYRSQIGKTIVITLLYHKMSFLSREKGVF